jgi:hypothetical protein
VQAGGDGDLQLGADAVGRGDKDRVLEAGGLGVEQGAEATQRGGRSGARRGLGQRTDRLDQRGPCVDIDTGRFISTRLFSWWSRYGVLALATIWSDTRLKAIGFGGHR